MDQKTNRSLYRFLFLLAWLFVGFVECYDVYWSIKLQDTLYGNELNPIGRFLISLDGGDIALFMTMKVAAIILILGMLPIILWSHKVKIAWLLLSILFISRLGLFVFIETGHLW
jgi:hypothetical protein